MTRLIDRLTECKIAILSNYFLLYSETLISGRVLVNLSASFVKVEGLYSNLIKY